MGNTSLIVAVAVLHVLALADVWLSRLTSTAKVLWTLTLLFLPGVGIAVWLLTRHSAYQPVDDLPAGTE